MTLLREGAVVADGEAAGQVLSAPVPDYAVPGIGSPALATALSGLAGAAVVFLVTWGLARLAAGRAAACLGEGTVREPAAQPASAAQSAGETVD